MLINNSKKKLVNNSRKKLGGLITIILLLQGCVTVNPATGGSDFTPFMSPARESALGKEQHPHILEQHGGVLDDPKIAGYVAVIGGRLAAVSEMPKSPFTFTVLNSPIVNAFALPGGYIYVTRGILALFNSEAELASVLGHEIGHVTARHSAKRYNQQLFTGLGVSLLGAALKNKEVSDALGYGSQLYLKSYSRDNEYESDQLGVRYSTRAGFDPYAAADMLHSLDAQSKLQDIIAHRTGQQRPPEFFSTHPNTKDRVQRAFKAAQQTGVAQGKKRGHDRFLNTIDGMIYGDDPALGVITGQNFTHPTFRFTFKVPNHYRLTNSADMVYAVGSGPAEGGIIIFAGSTLKGRNLIEFTSQTWASIAEKASLRGLQDLTINGMEAVTGWNDITVKGIPSQVRLVAIRHSQNQAFYFLTITPLNKAYSLEKDLQRMTYSFNRISARQAKKFKGKIIRVVTVKRGDTPRKLSLKMAFNDHRLDRFLVLNGLNSQSKLVAGQRVKLIINGK